MRDELTRRHLGKRLALCVALSVACLACATGATWAAPAVWLEPSMERISQNAPPGSKLSIDLFAAKGEYESFQVAIQAPEDGLDNVTVRVGDLTGPAGASIASTNMTIYREHYVHVDVSSPDPGGINRPLGIGWYADALVPLGDTAAYRSMKNSALPASFPVKARSNQPVWVDVFVPAEAPPGLYKGLVEVSADGFHVQREVRLVVWDFTLPLTPTLNSLFLIWKVNDQQAQAELLKHRLMPGNVHASNEHWMTDQLGLKSTNIGLWSEATNEKCSMAPPPPLKTVRDASSMHDSRLHHFSYIADEIDGCQGLYETMKAWARVLHAAGVDNLVTMTPVPELYDDGSGSGRSAVDIWVLLPQMYDSAPDRLAEVLRKGDQVWSYNALVQDSYSPKWQIDFAPINFRIQPGFMSQSLHLTGVLYWRVDLWTSSPWRNVQTYRNRAGISFPGEGMLLYPGEEMGIAGVVPSMRLKWLRDGVEDYEYIEKLKRLGCRDSGMRFARDIATSWRRWTREPVVLEQKRQKLGKYVEQAGQKGICSALQVPP